MARYLNSSTVNPPRDNWWLLTLALTRMEGDDSEQSDFEAWYQAVRYARGPTSPTTLEGASDMCYKETLETTMSFTPADGEAPPTP